jgi:hypothetical protein
MSDSNYFAGFQDWESLSIFYIIWHVLVTVLGTGLLYSIVWYESNSADFRYRTILNQILSHCCWIQIFACTLGRNAYLSYTLFGPFNRYCCDAIFLSGKFFYVSTPFELAIRHMIKLLYIFQWDRVVSLNDNFFAVYVTTCNVTLSFVIAFVAYFIGFHDELEYHICIGKKPRTMPNYLINKSGNSSIASRQFESGSGTDPAIMFTNILFVVLILSAFQIWWYSHKDFLWRKIKNVFNLEQICFQSKVGIDGSDSNNKLKITLSEEKFQESKSQIVGTGQTLLLLCLTLSILTSTQIMKTIVKKNIGSINTGPIRTWAYIGRMTLPTFVFIVGPVAILWHNDKMRNSIIRDFKERQFMERLQTNVLFFVRKYV